MATIIASSVEDRDGSGGRVGVLETIIASAVDDRLDERRGCEEGGSATIIASAVGDRENGGRVLLTTIVFSVEGGDS